MKMINSFDKEAEFESLEEAKEYYYPEMEMTEEDYTYVASIDAEHSTSFVINCDSDNRCLDTRIVV
jgi:hypothetical protein|nr:MAG TPA: hypothetical protein [Caudoviricetes sp.]